MIHKADNGDSIYLIEPSEIEVLDFKPYYSDKKYVLRFRPTLLLKLSEQLEVVISGYDEVWDYLDALFPLNPLPRAILNDAMRSYGAIDAGLPPEKWPSMLPDFNAFQAESSAGWVVLGVNESRPTSGLLGGKLDHYRRATIASPPLTKSQLTDINNTAHPAYYLTKVRDYINETSMEGRFAEIQEDRGRFAEIHCLPQRDAEGDHSLFSLVIREWACDGDNKSFVPKGLTIIQHNSGCTAQTLTWIFGIVELVNGVIIRPLRGKYFSCSYPNYARAYQLTYKYKEAINKTDISLVRPGSIALKWDELLAVEIDDLQYELAQRRYCKIDAKSGRVVSK